MHNFIIDRIGNTLTHIPDIFEAIIKRASGKPESLSEIYQNHEREYSTVLEKARMYDGNIPRELRKRILNNNELCLKIICCVACFNARMGNNSKLD